MQRSIQAAGAVTAFAYAIQTILSYWLGPAQVEFEQYGIEREFYPSLTGLNVPDILMHNVGFLIAYCTPMVIATVACMYLLIQVSRWNQLGADEPDCDAARSAFHWALIFAALNLPALPVQAQDMWASVSWGKMAASGLNPYHMDVPGWIGDTWFPDSYRPRMVYGPLWTLLVAIVGWLSDNRWVVFILMKLLLGAFWLTALVLVRRMTKDRRPAEQLLAMIMAGWLPVSVNQSLGDGHNDIAATALVLLWLYGRNTFALAAAVLVKYTVAPLAPFALLERRRPAEIAAAALVAVGLLAVFFRGPDFFKGNAAMLDWHFMTPRDALVWLGPFSLLGLLPFIGLAGITIPAYFRTRASEDRVKAVISTLALVLFCAYPLLWPWYLAAVLLPAALLPRWPMSIWVTGFSLAAPFSMLYHFRGGASGWMAPWPALIVYALALTWLLAMTLLNRRIGKHLSSQANAA